MSYVKQATKHFIFGHRSTQLFLKGLRRKLPPKSPSVIRRIRKEAEKIQHTHSKLVVDAPSLGHLEFTAHILAAYRILFDGEEKTIAFLNEAMMSGFNTWSMRLALGWMLGLCRGKPDRLYTIFGNLMHQYGIAFDWSAPHRHENEKCRFTFVIDRCFYFEFFKAHGVPNLTQILCQLDSLWFKQVDPKKHGFRFDASRYQTQGYGASRCLFPIIED